MMLFRVVSDWPPVAMVMTSKRDLCCSWFTVFLRALFYFYYLSLRVETTDLYTCAIWAWTWTSVSWLLVWTGTQVLLSTDKPWCVLVVTDVMTRAQSLHTADELVFIDSSCSCDVTQCTVTMVLVASKAGAIPVAVLLHEGQSAESYQAAFSRLLQRSSGLYAMKYLLSISCHRKVVCLSVRLSAAKA